MKLASVLTVFATTAAIALAVPAPEQTQVSSGTECLICDFLVKELDQYLTSPSTVSKIVGYIDDVCHFLPSSTQSACKTFIDQYGEKLVDWIASELNQNEICNDILGLGCSEASVKAAVRAAVKSFAEEELKGTTCEICKTVIGALQQALEDPTTANDIVQAVEGVCDNIGALKSICKDLIKDWAPDVISWLAKELEPNTVCSAIDACTTEHVNAKPQLLGGKRCTWGPSYWCQTEETARACGALVHCQTKVWTQEQ